MKLSLIVILLTITIIRGNATLKEMPVVADSVMHTPLSNASIFNCKGKMIGVSNKNGRLPFIYSYDYPITIRYMGFNEKSVEIDYSDTIFLTESVVELPEVVIETKKQRLLHVLAYVREYSTLTTYSDTIFLFREKMVDYMLPSDEKMKYKGWKMPRILKSKSYYQFTNSQGVDSVSDKCNHHFSWSDLVGIIPTISMPKMLQSKSMGVDTVYGKYSPSQIWNKIDDRVMLEVNVLADTTEREWAPNLSHFRKNNIDFEQLRVKYNYENVLGDTIVPVDMTGYSFNIESNGRGRNLFRFARKDEPFFVSTYAEVYVVDKEYITQKEAKQWEKGNFSSDEIMIFEPQEAPELQDAIKQLIVRVNNVDADNVRLAATPDWRLAGRKVERNFGQNVLSRIKGILGISGLLGKRKQEKQWKEFRQEQNKRNWYLSE